MKLRSQKTHSASLEDLFIKLDSSKKGLSSKEARLRLKEQGANTLPKAKDISIFNIVLRQFKNPFLYILVFALIISMLTAHFIDVGIIASTILISAIIGAVQEYKADKSLIALRGIIDHKAKVLRDGRETFISQDHLVVGDIIKIKSGDKVLADARLVDSENLQLNEAALTGESMPVSKELCKLDTKEILAERKNMLYSSTIIVNGRATAIVTATGLNTEIGTIANLIKDTLELDTPLQKQLVKFGQKLSLALIFLNILIFIIGILSNKPLYQMFLTSVALVVAAVPEGLVPAMSIILAIGMQRLAKKKGLVRKMLAAETLGSVSVICTDKTGTLTTGEMTLAQIIPTNHHDSTQAIMKAMTLCNDAIRSDEDGQILGNPTDKALLKASYDNGFDKDVLETLEVPEASLDFSSSLKYMATLHKKQDSFLSYIKGAPETIIEMSSLNDEEKNIFKLECEKVTSKGYRVIAIAQTNRLSKKDFSQRKFTNLELLGLIALKDPLRAETKEAISLCLQAGVRPIILTGDHKKTAVNIARELGFILKEDEVLEGFQVERLSFDELREHVSKVNLFARVEPKHKIKIVSALQANNEIVAMTGDGVNDSPALKKADIGVAVGSGTDIAKETADLILLDDNFMTIIEAIKSGRIIFNNLRKVVLCLLVDSFSEMIIVTGSVLLTLPLPILPAQILWVKLLEDTFPAVALSFEDLNEDVMESKPRSKQEPILNSSFIKLIAVYTLIMDSSLLCIFISINKYSQDLDYARTIVFVCLGITTLVGVFSIRSLNHHIWQIDFFSNKLLIYSFILSFSLYLAAIYHPFFNKILQTTALGYKSWLIISAYSIISILVYELCKKFTIMKAQ